MKMKYAFAVNDKNEFVERHFGDSDKFLIYEKTIDSEMVFINEESNIFKSFDEEQEHGSRKKAEAIMAFLKNINVDILVSNQFGKNIKRINNHFIPILVAYKRVEDVFPLLDEHHETIHKQLMSKSPEFNFFSLKSGNLRTSLKK